jgi:hypothetical protein
MRIRIFRLNESMSGRCCRCGTTVTIVLRWEQVLEKSGHLLAV